MKSMKKFFNRFVTDERGLAAVEYAVVAGLIAVALVAAFTALGDAAAGKIESLTTTLNLT
jgi:pilus assembly protein Flp/PilA